RLYYRTCCNGTQTVSDPFDAEMIKQLGIISANGDKPSEKILEETLDDSVPDEVNTQPTAQEQLEAILSTRARRWGSRYRSFNYRFLLPVYNGCRRLFGGK